MPPILVFGIVFWCVGFAALHFYRFEAKPATATTPERPAHPERVVAGAIAFLFGAAVIPIIICQPKDFHWFQEMEGVLNGFFDPAGLSAVIGAIIVCVGMIGLIRYENLLGEAMIAIIVTAAATLMAWTFVPPSFVATLKDMKWEIPPGILKEAEASSVIWEGNQITFGDPRPGYRWVVNVDEDPPKFVTGSTFPVPDTAQKISVYQADPEKKHPATHAVPITKKG